MEFTNGEGTWVARVFGNETPTTLLQSPEGPVYSLKLTRPDIWSVAIVLRNLPGVHRLATIDPYNDTIVKLKYTEYRYMTFPF